MNISCRRRRWCLCFQRYLCAASSCSIFNSKDRQCVECWSSCLPACCRYDLRVGDNLSSGNYIRVSAGNRESLRDTNCCEKLQFHLVDCRLVALVGIIIIVIITISDEVELCVWTETEEAQTAKQTSLFLARFLFVSSRIANFEKKSLSSCAKRCNFSACQADCLPARNKKEMENKTRPVGRAETVKQTPNWKIISFQVSDAP